MGKNDITAISTKKTIKWLIMNDDNSTGLYHLV